MRIAAIEYGSINHEILRKTLNRTGIEGCNCVILPNAGFLQRQVSPEKFDLVIIDDEVPYVQDGVPVYRSNGATVGEIAFIIQERYAELKEATNEVNSVK